MTQVTLGGGEKLEARLKAIADKIAKPFALRVGFLSGASYPDGTPVATVAVWNNFGTISSPARPFFTNMIRDKSGSWGEALVNRLKANDWDLQKSLEQMGAGIAGQLRQSIVDTMAPPNSPVTNLLKQRYPTGEYTFDNFLTAYADVQGGETAPAGKPLVWSGQMLASVDYEVEIG